MIQKLQTFTNFNNMNKFLPKARTAVLSAVAAVGLGAMTSCSSCSNDNVNNTGYVSYNTLKGVKEKRFQEYLDAKIDSAETRQEIQNLKVEMDKAASDASYYDNLDMYSKQKYITIKNNAYIIDNIIKDLIKESQNISERNNDISEFELELAQTLKSKRCNLSNMKIELERILKAPNNFGVTMHNVKIKAANNLKEKIKTYESIANQNTNQEVKTGMKREYTRLLARQKETLSKLSELRSSEDDEAHALGAFIGVVLAVIGCERYLFKSMNDPYEDYDDNTLEI